MGEYDNMHVLERDVEFDFNHADILLSIFRYLKRKLEIQLPERQRYIGIAQREFKGHFARVFDQNCKYSISECKNLITALGDAATDLQKYIDAAHQENENRKKFREAMANWEEEKRKIRDNIENDNRNTFISFQKDPAAHYPPQPQPNLDNEGPKFDERAPIIKSRNTGRNAEVIGRNRTHRAEKRARDAAQDATETTSAIPGNLVTFAQKNSKSDQRIAELYSNITKSYSSFAEHTSWGVFDAVSLFNSIAKWVDANQSDVRWILTVAEAFATAGSQGMLGPIYSEADFLDYPQYLNTGYIRNYLKEQKISTDRPSIDVSRATITGAVYSAGYALDPVNVATGNFIEHECDLSFEHAPAASLIKLERMYNSVAVTYPEEAPSGIFGLGWSSTLDTQLTLSNTGAVWHTPDGRTLAFPRMGDGFGRVPSESYWLSKTVPGDELYSYVSTATTKAIKTAENAGRKVSAPTAPAYYWVVYNSKHVRYFYDPSGAWTGVMEGHYATLTLPLYSSDSATGALELTDIVHPASGRGLQIRYGNSPRYNRIRPESASTYLIDHDVQILDTVTYIYDDDDLLAAVNRPDGIRRYTHNAKRLIEEVWDVNGHREVTNTYDGQGRVVHQLTEHSREVSFVYAPGIMTIVADAITGDSSNIWRSDEHGRLSSMTAADGSRQVMRYDKFGNRISVTERDGSTISRSYDSHSRLAKQLTPEGALSKYTWDEHNRLLTTSVCDFRDRLNPGDPVVVSYTYESTGANPNPITMTDGNGHTTEYSWDEYGNLLSVTDPTGVRTTYTYNARQELISITNGVGDTVHLEYDKHGRIVQVRDALGHVTSTHWNSAGQLASVTDAAGSRWSLTYPELAPEELDVPAFVRQNLTSSSTHCIHNTSRPMGQLPVSLTDPYGHVTHFEYNNGNQITAVTDPLGRTNRAVFDAWGNMVKTINALGAVTNYEYDGLSQLIAVTDPLGARSEFDYDLAGEISQITDATGVVTHRTVDRRTGKETTSSGGILGSSFRHVDYLGRVIIEGENNPQNFTSSQPVRRASQNSKSPSASPRNSETVTEFTAYDAAGNPVETLDAHGGLTRRTYDAANRLIREVSAAGRTQTFDYDQAGRLRRIGVGLSVPEQKPTVGENVEWEEPTAWAYTTLTYDAASRIIARTYPDGTTEHTTYDALGRIVRVQHGARTATYAYDRCSRLIRMSDNSAGTRRFIYDAAGQLVTAVDALGYRTHFEYDAAGQMVRTLDATGQVTTYIYDAAGQLIRTIKGAGSTAEITSTYTYDAAGRLLSENNGERTRAYSYDYQGGGLLASLSVNGVCAAEYSYSSGTSSIGHRTVTVRDYASASALRDRDSSAFAGIEKPYLEHRFVYDSSDRLISRSRSGFLRSDDQSNAHADDDIHERLHALNTFIKTGAYTLTYSYDADGYLITSVTPYAKSTRTVDGAGRTVAVTTHATGQPAHDVISSVFSYDPLGRLTRIRVGDMVSSWTHERTTGLISDYVREQVLADVRGFEESKVLERTQVIRDHNGRVIGLDSTGSDTSPDGLVLYSYDYAGQLVGARSASHVWEWEYTAGVMMRERVFALDSSNGSERSAAGSRVLEGERIFTHNEANQLVAVEARAYAGARGGAGELAAHTITDYSYNLAGERSGEVTTDKLTGASYSREYSWGAYGGLTSVTDSVSSRVGISRTSLISDAVGEVSAVSDGEGITVPLMWDARSDIPHLLGAGATSAPSSDGGFSQAGIPGGMMPWHTLNVPGLTGSTLDSALGSTPGLPTDWGVPSASATPVPGMPTGFEFTGAGSLRVAGLDMLGARVYDSPSRRFLSTDPKAAIAGSSWFADVYAYAGNNPLEYVDPRGERPMTVADYRKYQSQEGERFVQQSLRFLALVGVIGSLFIAPTSILLAGGVGFISGAANGAADGMDFHTPDGNIDWDKVQAYALQEGGKEALTAALIGMLFKAGPPVARATGNQAMKVPVISRTVDRVKTSPVVIKTQNTVNAVKTRINGIQDRIATWTRTSLLGIEHVVPKVHPTPHNSPHQIDIPNGPKPTHTGSLAHRTSGTVHEPNVQLKPVEEPKVENLPPAKGVASDSPSLEKPATDGKHASWVEHPPGSKLQNGDQTATYLAGDDFKKTLVKNTKDSSRYVPAEEPGTYSVYGFDEAKKLEREYYIKLNGGNSPADLSKGKPEFALWRPEVGEPNLDTAMTSFRDVTRHGNTVEAQVGSHKFMVTNLDEYTGTIPDDVVPTAKSLYETGEVHWTGRDYKPEGFGNVPDPLPFDNKEARILPTHDYAGNEIDYTKYRVRRLARTANQVNDPGAERLIVGSNGSMYYTPDHYKTFVRIF
ncbi:ribonuclease [Rothia dentocariosa ATCC 17931]|uniref:Ribonuclease n=1 Tax=Rothia dentocariosa (strain ATCC 17931 / CDC X599 / XDIA) TaxID=762948 RepID=E3GZT1_ROTDC|nr:DUF6531 domain-containing protein [Rothia dentocariosa]ADP39816.1 ribonuclease [Rothia dentocariosa ATCC 17931]WMS30728.1 DUF6531 domain-containing protein [Rothia dentocariosa]SUE37409.1 Cell wall-associated polypeptide CWBP200 [Rothia dentocariosa]